VHIAKTFADLQFKIIKWKRDQKQEKDNQTGLVISLIRLGYYNNETYYAFYTSFHILIAKTGLISVQF
jgi:hypothetical protein